MKLHEYVEWFEEDLVSGPQMVEVYAERLTAFIGQLKKDYANTEKLDGPKLAVLRWESPDFEHDVITELRANPGEWAVVQDLPARAPNDAAWACQDHERVELRRTYRAYYARYVTEGEVDGALESLLERRDAA